MQHPIDVLANRKKVHGAAGTLVEVEAGRLTFWVLECRTNDQAPRTVRNVLRSAAMN
jgi:hypothetical protein